MTTINTEIQNNADLSPVSKTIMSDTKGRYVSLFDGIFITVVVLLAVVIAIGAYFVYIHPVFFVPSIFIAMFIVFIAAVMGNVFHNVTTQSELSAERAEFNLLIYVMDNFVTFILVAVFLIIIASFAKGGSSYEP